MRLSELVRGEKALGTILENNGLNGSYHFSSVFYRQYVIINILQTERSYEWSLHKEGKGIILVLLGL